MVFSSTKVSKTSTRLQTVHAKLSVVNETVMSLTTVHSMQHQISERLDANFDFREQALGRFRDAASVAIRLEVAT